MATSFPTNQEAPFDFLPCLGIFFIAELFHAMKGLYISVFHCPLPMFCPMFPFEETPAHNLPVMSLFKYVIHINSFTPDIAISGIKISQRRRRNIKIYKVAYAEVTNFIIKFIVHGARTHGVWSCKMREIWQL